MRAIYLFFLFLFSFLFLSKIWNMNTQFSLFLNCNEGIMDIFLSTEEENNNDFLKI